MTTETATPLRTQADAIALIDETVVFYGADPKNRRSISMVNNEETGCLYDSGDGRRCAVGRCLLNSVEVQEKLGDTKNTPRAAHLPDRLGFEGRTLDSLLKPQYRGYPGGMWTLLQKLHDNPDNWDMDSTMLPALTARGIGEVRTAKEWVRIHSRLPQS